MSFREGHKLSWEIQPLSSELLVCPHPQSVELLSSVVLVKLLSYKLKKDPNYYMRENLPPFCNAKGRATLLLPLMYWKSQWCFSSVLFYVLISGSIEA